MIESEENRKYKRKIQIAWIISAVFAGLIGYVLVTHSIFWLFIAFGIGYFAGNAAPTISKKWFQSIENAIFFGSLLGFVAGLMLGGFLRLIKI
ncbi:MAG: hypothetical protein PVG66_02190 [Chromatiales bacterium]